MGNGMVVVPALSAGSNFGGGVVAKTDPTKADVEKVIDDVRSCMDEADLSVTARQNCLSNLEEDWQNLVGTRLNETEKWALSVIKLKLGLRENGLTPQETEATQQKILDAIDQMPAEGTITLADLSMSSLDSKMMGGLIFIFEGPGCAYIGFVLGGPGGAAIGVGVGAALSIGAGTVTEANLE